MWQWYCHFILHINKTLVIQSILSPCSFGFSDKLQTRLRSEGGIKALLGMVRCRHPDVLSQVARGIANFAKCESRAATQGKFFLSVRMICR